MAGANVVKNDAIDFLIYGYFGDTEDPYLASIDKAYLDMQTHTMKGDKTSIFKMRKKVTEYMYNRLKELPAEADFDVWHITTSIKMHEISKKNIELTYGQIQKWINMTVKYLYTLKTLGNDKIDQYFVDHKSEFHAPLDSFVLEAIDEKETWSTLPSYECYTSIKEKISFEDEYINWPSYARRARKKKDGTEKKADPGSYKRYIQDNYSDNNEEYCGEIRWKTTL